MNEREVKNRVAELFTRLGYQIHFCADELTLSDEVKIDFLASTINEKDEQDIIIVETKGDKPDKRYTEQLRIQKDYADFVYLACDNEVINKFEGGVEDQNVGLIAAFKHEAKIVRKAPRIHNSSKVHLSKLHTEVTLTPREVLEITCPIPEEISLILRFKSFDYPEYDKAREKIRCGFFTGVATQDYSLISDAILYTLNFSYNATAEMNACLFLENFMKAYSWRKIVAEYKGNAGKIPSLGKDKGPKKNISTYRTQFQECLESYVKTIFQDLSPEEINLQTCDKDHFMFYFDTLRIVCFNAEEGYDFLYEKLQNVARLGGHTLPWYLINLSLDTTGLLPIRVTEKVPISKTNDKSPQIIALKDLGLLDKNLKGAEAVRQYQLKVKEIADLIGISPKIIDIKLWWAQKDGFLGKK